MERSRHIGRPPVLRAARRGTPSWRRWVTAALALCAAQFLLKVQRELTVTHTMPLPPDALAHRLADFAVLARLHRSVGEWTIEAEGGNYTVWWYEVTYRCGRRCVGRARVSATAGEGAPRHGPAALHRVTATFAECGPPPLLPWPSLCDEWETETAVVGGAGGGSEVRESVRARCGLVSGVSGWCRSAVSALQHRRLAALRRLFAESPQ